MIVTIKKDKNMKKVTKGAYDNLYKGMGYTIVNQKQESKPLYKEAQVISENNKKAEKETKESK